MFRLDTGERRGIGFLLVFFAVLVSIVSLASSAAALDVPLTVRERDGVARTDEYITMGVPLEKGQIFSDQAVAIQGKRGQFQSLATWSDGSVKWLLCTFPVTIPANGTENVRLVNGSGNAPSGTLNVTSAGGTVTVNTGPLRFTLKQTGFNLFDEVWLDSNGDGSFAASERLVSPRNTNGVFVEDRDGNTFTSNAATSYTLTIEEAGPLRAVVKFEGRVKGSAGEHVTTSGRIFAYEGRSDVQVQFMQAHMVPTNTTTGDQPKCRWREGVGNQGGSDNSFWIEELSLNTQIDLTGGKTYSLQGSPTSNVVSGAISNDASMYQDSSGGTYWFVSPGTSFAGYQLKHGSTSLGSGLKAEGFADLSDGTRGLTVAIRHFWENFPNKLTVSPDGKVSVAPMPRDFSEPIEHRSGERKTHWTLYYFHDGTATAAKSKEVAAAFHHPMLAVASADYYGQTGVFDEGFVPYNPVAFHDYEVHNEATPWGWFTRRDDADFYGWQDFGDLWSDFEGGGLPPDTNKAANNLEYDSGYAMILQACRTSGLNEDLSYAWWKLAAEGNVHTADIDVYHVMEGPLHWLWGGMWNHTAHGASGYIDPHRGESPNAAHTWNRGMFYWYYFSGDRSVLDTALKVSENMTWRVENGPGMPGLSNTNGESRAPGHTLQIMLDTYLHTWDPRYLTAARRVVTESHFQTQAYAADYFSGDWATKPWMIAILMKQLGRFIHIMALEQGTVEQDAIDSLLGYADFMEQRCFVDRSGSQPCYYHYKIWGDGTNNPGGMNVDMWTLRASDAFTWAYRYETDATRKARYRQIAQHSFEDGSAYPWCLNCPRLEYTQAKVAQVVASSGMEWMEEVNAGGIGSDPTPPAAITTLQANVSGTTITLSWTAVGDDGTNGQALSYQVRRSPTPITNGAIWSSGTVVSGAPIPGPAGTAESMLIDGTPDGTWYFGVRALDDGLNLGDVGNSPVAVINGGGGDTTPPILSNIVVAETAPGTVTFSWDTDEPANSVVRYDFGGFEGDGLDYNLRDELLRTSHSLSLSGLTAGQLVIYRIRSFDAAGNLGDTTTQTITVAGTDDVAPTIVSLGATVDGNDMIVVWLTNEPANSFVEWGATTAYGSATSDPTYVTQHLIPLTGITQGSTVHYRVRSTDPSGNTVTSADRTFVFDTDATGPQIENPRFEFTSSQAMFRTTTDEPSFGSLRWGMTSLDENLVLLGRYDAPATTHEALLEGLVYGVTYQWEVGLSDPSGNLSVQSGTFQFLGDQTADTTPPVAPAGLRVTSYIEDAGVVLQWNANAESDLAGYNLYRRPTDSARETNSEWEIVNTSLLGETAFVDTQIGKTAYYEYAVSAEDLSQNESARSTPVFFNPEAWIAATTLQPAFPNPFSREAGTDILFRAPPVGEGRALGVSLDVYDVGGRLVRNLYSGPLQFGEARMEHWDGTDDRGQQVASGVYFYRLRMGRDLVPARKLIVLN
ncbi:MAG: hypothetical protein KC591_04645 [Gemmatimonadetes bacterium]|nr:hypothetical protein [Gemmatimonadota bacterium]